MLNSIIRFALQQRLFVIAIAVFLIGFGTWKTTQISIDVFPDLDRPRVVIMTEAHGMAPEEVETLISFPLETALNGANGVEVVRSISGVGLSVIYVEFEFGTDIFTDRQIVMERMQTVQDRLPQGISPQLAPISSIMGQVLILGMWSEDDDVSDMELRTTADWVIRQRLLTVPGVAQVFTMGGERKQYQVLVDPDAMVQYDVTLDEIERAVSDSNINATGGYLDEQGHNELLVRALGRITSLDELKNVVVSVREKRSITLGQVADVAEAGQVKRGDSAAFIKDEENDQWSGGPAVVLTINKQPGADTRRVTEDVLAALEELESNLPGGVHVYPFYAQKSFIDRAIENVVEALRDGGILVVIILFLFLVNLRTTFITLTAIPLSLVVTAIVFAVFDFSINTMTLGGLAVAIGELVDDAIVDVEKYFSTSERKSKVGKAQKHIVSGLSSQCRSTQLDCVWDPDCDSCFHSAICTGRHGRSTICSTWSGLHCIDTRFASGFPDGHSSALLLVAGPYQIERCRRKGRVAIATH